MKKYIIAFFAFVCMCMAGVVKAENYAGNMTIKVNGVAQPAKAVTVQVEKQSSTADLNISGFSFLGFTGMNINLDCQWSQPTLSSPVLTVNPPTIEAILGTFEVKKFTGTLDDNSCSIELMVYAPNVRQNVEIVFEGTK